MEERPVIQNKHNIIECLPNDNNSPFINIQMGDKVVCRAEADSGWIITKVYTDYTFAPNSHKKLIVVFEPEPPKEDA